MNGDLVLVSGRECHNENIASGPYEDLYIYHIRGSVSHKDEQTLGEHFMGNWVEDDYSFLFFSNKSNEILSEFIRSRPGLELIDDYCFTYEQWQGGGLAPFRVDSFTIMPPWARVRSENGEIRLLLDPGVVFGNGLHPTTRDCLKAMCHVNETQKFKRVLDLGTGSGILAIAAAYLGAMDILAVDLNPLCVKTAKRNARLNGYEDIIKIVTGLAEDFAEDKRDLVVANIHYEAIKGLFKHEGFLESERLIISGLLRTQASDIRDRIKLHGLKVINEWDHEMTWYTLLVGKS